MREIDRERARAEGARGKATSAVDKSSAQEVSCRACYPGGTRCIPAFPPGRIHLPPPHPTAACVGTRVRNVAFSFVWSMPCLFCGHWVTALAKGVKGHEQQSQAFSCPTHAMNELTH